MKAAIKLIGPALVIGGGVLLYFAYEAHNSASGQITSFISGDPSEKALQFGVAGAVCLFLGLGGSKKAFFSKAKK